MKAVYRRFTRFKSCEMALSTNQLRGQAVGHAAASAEMGPKRVLVGATRLAWLLEDNK